jgi:hypothetical protein
MEGVIEHIFTHEHPSFLQMFFYTNNGPFSMHKRDELQLNIDIPQGDFGTMQHLHFFLPNLRRGIGNLVGR